MTKAKPYNISKPAYTKIVIQNRFKKSWWLYALMFLLGMFQLKNFGKDSFSTFFIIFAFLYPISVVVFLYIWTNSKGHAPIFKTTHLAFDNEYLYFERNDNETKLNPKSIQNVVSNTKNWLLYVSKGQFIYVPKDIFYSEDDSKKFSAIINLKP